MVQARPHPYEGQYVVDEMRQLNKLAMRDVAASIDRIAQTLLLMVGRGDVTLSRQAVSALNNLQTHSQAIMALFSKDGKPSGALPSLGIDEVAGNAHRVVLTDQLMEYMCQSVALLEAGNATGHPLFSSHYSSAPQHDAQIKAELHDSFAPATRPNAPHGEAHTLGAIAEVIQQLECLSNGRE